MQSENKSLYMRFGSLMGYIKKKKLMFGIIAVAGISLIIYFMFSGPSKASGDYLTGTVQRGDITNSISASGTIEPVSTVSMSFKNAEIVKKIYVKVGEHVDKGQLLAELDTGNLENSVRQAQANLKSAQASLTALLKGATQQERDSAEADVSMAQAAYDLAKSTLDRNKALYDSGALSKSDLESFQVEYTNAEARLKQSKATLTDLLDGAAPEDIAAAEAQVENARTSVEESESDLKDARMVSPVDGIVSTISGAEGQRASANNNSTSGEGFLELISQDLQMEAQVNEGDIGQVKLGQKVEFTVNSYPDKVFYGRVSSIAPVAYAESNVQIYDVIIQLDENFEELKAGMPADVTIIVEQKEDVLIVPKGAVTFAAGHMTAMRQGSGTGPGGGSGNADPGKAEDIRKQVQDGTLTREQAREQLGIKDQGGGSEKDGAPAATAKTATGEEKSAQAGKVNGQVRNAMVLVKGKSDSPEPRRVQLGMSDLTSYEVINGLSEGETVVTGLMSQSAAATSGASGNRNSGARPSGGAMPMGGGRVMIR